MNNIAALTTFMQQNQNLLVITGAGLSANAGIPTYRNDQGEWQRSDPIMHDQFINQLDQRQRYWSRSTLGWPILSNAKPSPSHHYLAWLETTGQLKLLVTQNVDRLHQQAGNERVIDLHGRVDRVVCLSCSAYQGREALQTTLLEANPFLFDVQADAAPDGDADFDDQNLSRIVCPSCQECNGVLMPDVIFYGGNVPRDRVQKIMDVLENADGLLILGSSLMVHSAYRFCKAAVKLGIPIAAVNRGLTRADDLLAVKVEGDCDEVLLELGRQQGYVNTSFAQ